MRVDTFVIMPSGAGKTTLIGALRAKGALGLSIGEYDMYKDYPEVLAAKERRHADREAGREESWGDENDIVRCLMAEDRTFYDVFFLHHLEQLRPRCAPKYILHGAKRVITVLPSRALVFSNLVKREGEGKALLLIRNYDEVARYVVDPSLGDMGPFKTELIGGMTSNDTTQQLVYMALYPKRRTPPRLAQRRR